MGAERVRIVQEHSGACFRLLDENFADKFKVSNVPTLIGWNVSMTIGEILNQLNSTYG
jgi:hypothetical protein